MSVRAFKIIWAFGFVTFKNIQGFNDEEPK